MKTTKQCAAVIAIISGILLFSGCQDPNPSTAPTTSGATKPYPLDVCIVSGEKLGSMGAPIVLVHQGQEVKFCCKNCKPDFEKEPAKFLAKLAPKK